MKAFKKRNLRKRVMALCMCLLMVISVCQGVNYVPRADEIGEFLDIVTGMQITPGDSGPVEMSEQFKVTLDFKLPDDSSKPIQDNYKYRFNLSQFHVDDTSLSAFITSSSTDNNGDIQMGNQKVGTFTITDGEVLLDFSIGIDILKNSETDRTGEFWFSCGLNDDNFDDNGGEYTIKFDTVNTVDYPRIELEEKPLKNKGLDISKGLTEYNQDTKTAKYTITVKNDNDAPVTGLVIKDEMSQYLQYNGDGSPFAATKDGNNLEFKFDAPKGTTTITYSCKVSDGAYLNANGTNYVNNKIKAEVDGKNIYLNDSKDTYKDVNVQINKDVVGKTASVDDHTINWTITINSGDSKFDLQGYNFSDTFDRGKLTLDEDSVVVTGGTTAIQNGIKNAIITGTEYTFPSTTDSFTVTYKTEAPETSGVKFYENKVVVENGEFKDEATVYSPGIGSTHTVKTFAGNDSADVQLELDSNGNAILPWNSDIYIESSTNSLEYRDYFNNNSWGDCGVDFDRDSLDVTFEGNTLIKGTDYEVSYTNNGYQYDMKIVFKPSWLDSVTTDGTVTIKYNTLGIYNSDKTSYTYTNNFETKIDGESEYGSASVTKNYKDTNFIKKTSAIIDAEKGIIEWYVEADASETSPLKNLVLTDIINNMAYIGYDGFTYTGGQAYVLIKDSDYQTYKLPVIVTNEGTEKKPQTKLVVDFENYNLEKTNTWLEPNVVDGKRINKRIIISYRTQISGDLTLYNNTTIYKNHVVADATDDDGKKLPEATAESSQEIEYKVIDKGKGTKGSTDGNSIIAYQLALNPLSKNLNVNADYYVVEDTLPGDLIYILDGTTVKCGGISYTLAASADEVKKGGVDSKKYFVTYSNNKITFYVPDEKAIDINYKVSMLNNSACPGKSYVNSAKIAQPYVEINSQDSNERHEVVSAAAGNITEGKLKVKKVDVNDLTKGLKGAEFTIIQKKYEGASWVEENRYTATTPDSGLLYDNYFKDNKGNKFSVTPDRIYEIKETVAPEGYTLSSKTYQVYYPDEANTHYYNLPAGTYPFSDGTTFLFTDTKSDDIELSKELTLTAKKNIGSETTFNEKFKFYVEKLANGTNLNNNPSGTLLDAEGAENTNDGKVNFGIVGSYSMSSSDTSTKLYYYKVYENQTCVYEGIDVDGSYYIIKDSVKVNSAKTDLDVERTITKYTKTNTGYTATTLAAGDSVEFVNKRKSTNISLKAEKTIDGSIEQLEADKFSFSMIEVDAGKNVVSGGFTDTKTNDASGIVAFDSITYDAIGTHYYKIKEETLSDTDYTCDTSYYIAKVDVTVDILTKGFKATITSVEKYNSLDVKQTGNFIGNIAFDNKKIVAGKKSAKLTAVKTLIDETMIPQQQPLKANQFSFDVIEVDGDASDAAAITGAEVKNIKIDADGDAIFTTKEFEESEAGTYYYKVYEHNDADKNYIYDDAFYIVALHVNVENHVINFDGTSVKKFINNNGTYEEDVTDNSSVDNLGFTNKVATVEVTLAVSKEVLYGNIADYGNEFSFKAESVNVTPGVNITPAYEDVTRNDDTGKVVFRKISFDAKNVSLNQYIYKITEITESNNEVECDDTVLYAVVTLSQKADNSISYDVVYHKGSYTGAIETKPTFTNKKKLIANASISGTKKVVDMANNPLDVGLFNFGLYDSPTSTTPIKRVTNGSGGSFSFDLSFDENDYNASKSYVYYVKEIEPSNPLNGYEYNINESVYTVTVTLTLSDGSLDAAVTYDDGTTGGTPDSNVEFVNRFNIDDSWPLSAVKFLENSYLNGGDFEFELVKVNYDNGVVTEIQNGEAGYVEPAGAKNDSDGNIIFRNAAFNYPADLNKTYYYVMREKNGGNSLINYAKDEYLFKVHIIQGSGTDLLAREMQFKKKSGNTWDAAWTDYDPSKIVFKNSINVKIDKVDAGNINYSIPDAQLALYDSSDHLVGTAWTTNGADKLFENIVADEEYTLKENVAPFGYEKSDDVKFKVVYENNKYVLKVDRNDGAGFVSVANNRVIMMDAHKTFKISKQDAGGEYIDGATLKITKKYGGDVIVAPWTTDTKSNNPKEIDVVEAGMEKDVVYVLTEEIAPYGYKIAESIEFKIIEDNKIVTRSYDSNEAFKQIPKDELIMKDDCEIMSISKTDIDGIFLPGAWLEIKDADGTVIEKWKTELTPKEISLAAFDTDKTYILTEITAPFGYEIAESIEFKIGEDYNISYRTLGSSGAFTLADGRNISMEDKNKILEFSKADAGGVPISGAKLIITEGTPDGNVIVPEWTSKADSAESIDLLLFEFKEDVVYVLTEKTAPFGYEKAESIEFKITGDNKVYTKNYGSNDEFSLVTKDVITMEDAHKSFVVKKVDDKGKEIGGASLSIVDYLNREVTSWTTVAGESKIIDIVDNEFKANTVYKLKEDKAPAGYEKADEILFMFDADCNLHIKVSDQYVLSAEGNIIVMVDNEEVATTTEATTTEVTTTEKTTAEKVTTEEVTTEEVILDDEEEEYDDEDEEEYDEEEDDETEDDNDLTESNDKLNDNDSISTGDHSHANTVFMVMIMSLAGFICVLIKKREQEKR